jgi:hypothetical protein
MSHSTVTREFEPGVIYDTRIGVGSKKTGTAGGVDYDLALQILDSTPPRYSGLIRAENGAVEIERGEAPERFVLFGGLAHRTSEEDIPVGSECYNTADEAVSDASDWRWVKLKVSGGPFDGWCCLGLNAETRNAVAVAL